VCAHPHLLKREEDEPRDRVVPAKGRRIMMPVEGAVQAMPVAPRDMPRVR
jgi:hypothetical protein